MLVNYQKTKIMKKNLLLLVSFLLVTLGYSQKDKFWSPVSSSEGITKSKSVQRMSFPQEYTLYNLNLDAMRQALSSAPNRFGTAKSTTIISIPGTDGKLERFEMYEASNFTEDLQAQYPEIRAYVGVGIDDKYAQIRISAAPSGIQTMIFRVGKKNEFMEPFSADGKVYAAFNSSRNKGSLPFTCSTDDVALVTDLTSGGLTEGRSNAGTYKTMRLALSCTGEYANYFGATSAANSGLVLAAFNATMTRVNGVFEKDFALHLNIIAQTTNVIYYNPATDPYSDSATGTDPANTNNTSGWNVQLQNTLSANLTGTGTTLAANNAVYDIGHLFGADGGGGNAGCIGCVCVNDTATTTDKNKGSGYTSPADAIPAGDNFDIDYVAHEMGHQVGCNHTFSHSAENNTVNLEPGSGSTIMGYAGITGATDVQAHSDDYFSYGSILQTQTNLSTKTCPVSVAITHGVPTVDAGLDYTIPKSTPYKLTGTGSDPSGSPVTFCWEQNDDATTVGAAASYPSPTKTQGPNYRSLDPVAVPYRFMPEFSSVLNNVLSTTWEATSSVARTLNFALTCRDNVAGGGLTNTDFMVVTVDGTKGPFDVTSQNTSGISWTQGSTQTITWVTNGAETLAGSSTVDILLSTDGGATFPTVLAAATPNDGSQTITVPNVAAVNCRIMIKPTGNIYYDVNTTPFAIGYTISTTCNSYSNNASLSIPDGVGANLPGTTVSKTLTVPVTGTLSDVNVTVQGAHTYYWDLIVSVTHPDATVVRLMNRICNLGTANTGFNVVWNDASPAVVCANTLAGTFAPSDPLSALNGKPANGTWTLNATDNYNGDVGTITTWTVEVCTQTAVLMTESFGLDNFSLFPNPNNGNFNIKFNSTSNNEIAINVHDMRGRQVFSRTYQNSGLFDQNLQLNNVQAGVYLVTVQDGNKKEVKKIVVQ